MNTVLKLRALNAHRIVIVGPPGAGKSTLARMLAHALDLPIVSADRFFWNDDGSARSISQLRASVATELSRNTDGWIFEGHFKSCHDLVLPQADAVVEISIGAWTALWRLCTREIRSRPLRLRLSIRKIAFTATNRARIEAARRAALANYRGPILRTLSRTEM